MHDAQFLCYKVSLRVVQTPSHHPPHSQHARQELKDDLLDYTTWPVVEQWFNALTAVGALMTLIDFNLSNARRFYSSMGNPKVKGLMKIISVL